MAEWRDRIRGVREIIDSYEDGDSSEANIKAIHAIISKRKCFAEFSYMDEFEDFEDSGDYEYDMEEANSLIHAMYDYADGNRIWVE